MLSKFVYALNGAGRCGKSLCAALVLFLALGAVSDASAQSSQQKRAALRANSPFNLQAGATQVLQANLVQCGLDNTGNVCTDIFNSPTGGGGFWPAGTVNQYIFNSGLQIAGINGTNAGPWANDTVGAYFFDARGTQPQGSPRTGIFNSLNADDLANWPAEAFVTDTALFNSALIGSKSISDQDTWVKYWDGDPNKLGGGRKHPMGIEVTQRSLAFNAPSGAENTLFLIYRFKNVTNQPDFQLPNEAKFSISLPDAGWTIDSIFAALGADMDVSANGAGANFSTPILPFNIGVAYHATFTAPEFNFAARADLYAPPFFAGPGFVGVKYLRSPVNPATKQQVGLTMFTNNTNGGAFPDPLGEKQLWRYLSGNITPGKGDPPCNIANPKVARLCYLAQDPADTRFIEASGPFSLKAGEEAVIVVAYTHGAPLKAGGYVQGNQQRPGIPSRTPGTSATDTIRTIERIAGMISVPPAAIRADGSLDETKIIVQPKSILANALIAQAMFNIKFLLPRPPEPPAFTLVPGNDQITIVWTPTATDKNGDPYFKIASDPTNPALFDPNYRQFDVAGYRIYKATGLSGAFTPIIQYDKIGDVALDFTGQFDPTFVPEECPGTQTVQDCYKAFVAAAGGDYPVAVPLTGDVVQFPAGGRVRDKVTGSIFVVKADTVHGLTDSGVPFAFVDHEVKNGITYRYAVTAFDINSLKSGAATLESPRQQQPIVPRPPSSNFTAGSFSIKYAGTDGVALDTSLPYPAVDADKGTFATAMPPTNGFAVAVEPFIPEVATKAATVTVKIDSIKPGNSNAGVPAIYYLSVTGGPGGTQSLALPLTIGYTDGNKGNTVSGGFTVATADASFIDKFKLAGATLPGAVTLTAPDNWYQSGPGRAMANGRTDATVFQGGRWFVSGTAEAADPNAGMGSFANVGGFSSDWVPGGLRAGAIAGEDIFSPKAYLSTSTNLRSVESVLSTVRRVADIEVTWGAAGAITSVQDLTHHVPVAFSPRYGATWGFLNPASFAGVTAAATRDGDNALITAADWQCVEPYRTFANAGLTDFNHCTSATPAVLQNTAVISQVDTTYAGAVAPATTRGPGTGKRPGFALYINGELFHFFPANGQLPASGTKWTLRTYAGYMGATAVKNANGVSTDVNGYHLNAATRPPNVPGLTAVITVVPTTVGTTVTDADLENVHTVPDPYFVRSQYELGPNNKVVRFVNLPSQAIVRIYSVNGTLVRVLEHNDATAGGDEKWDLRNRNNQFVATGVYFYVVEGPGGSKKTGRLTVLQFAR
jgi:hypothetical protein